MIIATPVLEDPGVRLFIGWQATVDLVFEAFRSDANNPFEVPAVARLNAGQFLESA